MMYVQRDLRDRFRMLSDAINIIALIGPRQCGKTISWPLFVK